MNVKSLAWPWLKAAKFCVDTISWPVFLLRKTPPWTMGYQFHKQLRIRRSLPPHTFREIIEKGHYGLHLDERVVEYPWLFERLPSGSGRLLDAGSALNYGFLLRHKLLSEKQVFISTLAPEAFCHWRRGISYIFEDLRSSCYRDDYFDWIVCLSTLEHIGLDNCMLYTSEEAKKENCGKDYLLAVRELYRILKPGGRLFLTVPFGRYRNHGWFQVFDAAMIDNVLAAFAPAHHQVSYFKYDPDGWRMAQREELQDADYFDIHASRKLDPDWAASARGSACVEMVK